MPIVLPSASSGQRRRPEWSDLAAQYRARACPCRTLRRHRCRRRRMTRGRRGSLRLRRLALSSIPFCRFIPAHPDLLTWPERSSSAMAGLTGAGVRTQTCPLSSEWQLGAGPEPLDRTCPIRLRPERDRTCAHLSSQARSMGDAWRTVDRAPRAAVPPPRRGRRTRGAARPGDPQAATQKQRTRRSIRSRRGQAHEAARQPSRRVSARDRQATSPEGWPAAGPAQTSLPRSRPVPDPRDAAERAPPATLASWLRHQRRPAGESSRLDYRPVGEGWCVGHQRRPAGESSRRHARRGGNGARPGPAPAPRRP
jgi:hypothetical protein